MNTTLTPIISSTAPPLSTITTSAPVFDVNRRKDFIEAHKKELIGIGILSGVVIILIIYKVYRRYKTPQPQIIQIRQQQAKTQAVAPIQIKTQVAPQLAKTQAVAPIQIKTQVAPQQAKTQAVAPIQIKTQAVAPIQIKTQVAPQQIKQKQAKTQAGAPTQAKQKVKTQVTPQAQTIAPPQKFPRLANVHSLPNISSVVSTGFSNKFTP